MTYSAAIDRKLMVTIPYKAVYAQNAMRTLHLAVSYDAAKIRHFPLKTVGRRPSESDRQSRSVGSACQ